MKKNRPKVEPSIIVHVAIKCGACDQTSNHNDLGYIDAGQCDCGPDNYTCMCDTSKTIDFQCPLCKYFGTIEL